MPSIFSALRHRYGAPRPRLSSITPADMPGGGMFRAPLPPDQWSPPNGLSVTVIGAGLAGLMTAAFLGETGFAVTVLEARQDVGGRVRSRTDVCSGRLIEAGAELIGANHPMWLGLASAFGLGLSVFTSEDEFTAASLDMPLYLDGQLLRPGAAEDIYGQMDDVFEKISEDAAHISTPYEPWRYPGALNWDKLTVADKLLEFGVKQDTLLWSALATELGNNQAVPVEQQSYLGLTAAVRGGQLGSDIKAFWTESEVYRCEAGTQALAWSLRDLIVNQDIVPVQVLTGKPADTLIVEPARVTVTSGGTGYFSDYAVLASPQPTWRPMTFSPPLPADYYIATGPAIKYLSRVKERFWLKDRLAPFGLSDSLGMTWEGTDNQMAVPGQGLELSVFAGGRSAVNALSAPDKQKYFTASLSTMYPAYPGNASGPGIFMDWPGDPWTRCGYSCPAPLQVTGAAQLLAGMWADRVAFAGEHTVMAMFGYMEGALESGLFAAGRIFHAARQS